MDACCNGIPFYAGMLPMLQVIYCPIKWRRRWPGRARLECIHLIFSGNIQRAEIWTAKRAVRGLVWQLHDA